MISAVAKRLRSRMRGKDTLGRFSGNKFGLVLRDCTPDDMAIAAERMLTTVRDEMVPTSAGPIAITVTIGGVTAPRHARSVAEVLARAQESLDTAKARRRGSFQAYRPNIEREAMRRENVRATDEIVAALNERRIFLAYETVAASADRQPAFYECLMRIRRTDGSLIAANDIVPVAERLGLVRLLDFRVLELVIDEMIAAPALQASFNVSPASTTDPDWWAGLGSLLRSHAGVAERLIVEITESAAIHDIDETRGFVAASRISAAASPSTISAPATRRFAICANSASISSRSTAPSCSTSCARKTIALSCARSSTSPNGSSSRPWPNGCRTKPRQKPCRHGAAIICRARLSALPRPSGRG